MSAQPALAVNALVYYHDDGGGLGTDMQRIATALTFFGYTVTTINVTAAGYLPGGAGNSATAGDNWASYQQVWDGRFNSTGSAACPAAVSPDNFTANWQATAQDYVGNHCGNLFLLGENSGYMSRNQGNYEFLLTVGGIKAGFVACGAPSVNGVSFGGGNGTFAMTGPGVLAGAPIYFADEGGIPDVAPNYLNGTSLHDFAGGNYGDGVARSGASVWTGAAQMVNLSGCNVGVVVTMADMDQWSGCCWLAGSLGTNTADLFVKAVAQYFVNHTCSCATNTFTPTMTNTPTPTVTRTPTNTVTSSPTNTVTNTFTNTNTKTVTNTPTNTNTPSYTPTPTNSVTPSATNTVTNTQTNTKTVTDTPTLANTFTSTNTQTNTATPTDTLLNTATNTSTATPTGTDTNTPTNSDTPTVTNSATSTYSPTNTYTATNTETLQNTATDTNTVTVSNTQTPSSTPSFTNTVTNTQTNTNTITVQPTNTQTMTSTPTSAVSMGKSVNETFVHPGDILTYNIGVTVKGNNLINAVVVDTLPAYMNFVSFGNVPAGTVTVFSAATDLIEWTLPSPLSPGIYDLTYSTTLTSFAPANIPLVNKAQLSSSNAPPLSSSAPVTVVGQFTVKINIYNSAGEVIKTINIQTFTQPVNNITLSTTNTITSLKGKGNSINIIYNGVVIGTWDGTNNQGQPVTNGNYKVQVDSVGQSGVVTSVAQNAIVNRSLANITANVYNGAGELVRKLYYLVDDPMGSNMTNVTLNSAVLQPTLTNNPSNASGAPNLAKVLIETSGAPVTLLWDGTNNENTIVTPGQYTIEVHWDSGGGQSTDISRTILVMTGSGITGKAIAKPNSLPNNGSWSTTFDVSNVASNVSGLRVRVYTLSGQLVANLVSSSNQVDWNAYGFASGIYVANVEARTASGGVITRQFVKVLLMH